VSNTETTRLCAFDKKNKSGEGTNGLYHRKSAACGIIGYPSRAPPAESFSTTKTGWIRGEGASVHRHQAALRPASAEKGKRGTAKEYFSIRALGIILYEPVQINQPNRPHRFKIHSIFCTLADTGDKKQTATKIQNNFFFTRFIPRNNETMTNPMNYFGAVDSTFPFATANLYPIAVLDVGSSPGHLRCSQLP
jgi:hypothetical protein